MHSQRQRNAKGQFITKDKKSETMRLTKAEKEKILLERKKSELK